MIRPGSTGTPTEAGRYWSPERRQAWTPATTAASSTARGPGAGVSSRFDRNFLNERENYFHKPQVNLNWYSYLGNGLTANTVAYYSGGQRVAARARTGRCAGTIPTASVSPIGTLRSRETGAATTARPTAFFGIRSTIRPHGAPSPSSRRTSTTGWLPTSALIGGLPRSRTIGRCATCWAARSTTTVSAGAARTSGPKRRATAAWATRSTTTTRTT